MRATATPAVVANSEASTAALPAAHGRWWLSRLRNPLATGLIAIALAAAAPAAHPAQPPGDAAAALAANGRLDAALTLLDGWLAEHPGDARLFPLVLQVVTAAPEQRTVDAVLGRYEKALGSESVGVLRAVPVDWAELRGGVEQALNELRRSRLPDAGRRQALLLLELGQIGGESSPREAPIAVHAGLARAGQGLDNTALEESLRKAFARDGHADGGADGAVAGYGLVALLSATGRSSEAAAVLEALGRRFPRSPEYALAAAELRAGPLAGGAALPQVVVLPSPSMLLGGAVLACPAPCLIPAVAAPRAAKPAPEVLTPAAPAVVEAPATPAAPASSPRQADGVAARTPPAATPAGEPRVEETPRVEEVVLVPVRLPAADAGPPRRAEDVPAARSTSAAATTEPHNRRAGSVTSTAIQSSPSARSSGGLPRQGGGAAPQPADRGAARAETRTASPQTTRSQPAADQPPPTEAASGAKIRVVALPGHTAAAPARAPAADSGKVIRVTAQPATRAQLSTDRVFVPAETRAETVRRSQPSRTTAVAAGAAAARASTSAAPAQSSRKSAVRVASLPDPAAFVVQVGAYLDPDNALDMEMKLRRAGFAAVARSYRTGDGSIVHRIGVGGNVTRGKGEQMLTRLENAGFAAYISRRDVVSYLPPEPRQR